MATVYNRIMELQQRHEFPFRFNIEGIRKVGYLINNEWRKDYNLPLPYIESIEHSGTYPVANYPDYFTLAIDKIIINYARMVEEKRKKNLEKKKALLVIMTEAKPIKKRKRIKTGALQWSAKINKTV